MESYFVDLIAAAGIAPPPEIFPGTCAELRVPESHAVLCIVESVDCVIAGLHKAQVRLAVSSPTDSRADHAALASQIRAAAQGGLPAGSGFTVGGWRTKSTATVATDDGRWVTSLEGTLALDWTGV